MRRFKFKKKIFFLSMIGIALLFSGGCYSLRKKFIRKRKETPAPLYLELKEYPEVPSEDMYNEYYLFVRGWLDELIQAIRENTSPKRQKKSIDEAIKNLEQIIYFYNQQGKEKISPLYTEFKSLREKIYDPYFIFQKNHTYIIRKIEKLKRKFEKNFTYEKASQWIKP